MYMIRKSRKTHTHSFKHKTRLEKKRKNVI